jgi:hypothetical protein
MPGGDQPSQRGAILNVAELSQNHPQIVVNKTGFSTSRRFGRDSFPSRSGRRFRRGFSPGRRQDFLHFRGAAFRT